MASVTSGKYSMSRIVIPFYFSPLFRAFLLPVKSYLIITLINQMFHCIVLLVSAHLCFVHLQNVNHLKAKDDYLDM